MRQKFSWRDEKQKSLLPGYVYFRRRYFLPYWYTPHFMRHSRRSLICGQQRWFSRNCLQGCCPRAGLGLEAKKTGLDFGHVSSGRCPGLCLAGIMASTLTNLALRSRSFAIVDGTKWFWIDYQTKWLQNLYSLNAVIFLSKRKNNWLTDETSTLVLFLDCSAVKRSF